MSRVILAVLVIVAVASAFPSSSTDCGVNEEFVRCGSTCEPSCALSEPHSCTLKCVVGCQCKAGFLRSSTNSCVLPSEC